jgi:hypothetical protein
MTATLSERRVTRAELTLPYSGIWHADVWLDEPAVLSGSVTFELDGLSLKGTIATGDAYAGAADYRVIGGAAGWRKELPAKGYQSDAGVKLSMVLGDAAKACGESVALAPGVDRDLGPAYARPKAQAIRTLSLLAQTPFWVDSAGVTQLGARTTGVVTTQFELVGYEPKERVAVVASETPEVFEPGYTVSLAGAPSMTIGTVVHRLDEGSIRTELWGRSGTETERLTNSFRAIVRELVPELMFRGVFEYRVVAQSGDRLDLTPARPGIGLPALAKVPVRYGFPGARATYATGASVLVAFVDGEPTRPVVIGHTAPDDAAADPSEVQLADTSLTPYSVGTGAIGRVVRWGDSYLDPVSGPTVLVPGVDGTTPVSRVKA